MGIKARKHVRVRDLYDAQRYDQDSVDPDDIPADAPMQCQFCKDTLTPLRRTSGRAWCTKEDCLLAGRLVRTANWRMANLHKQGDCVVIVGDGEVINTSKRGV
jgi:hypothetical protein